MRLPPNRSREAPTRPPLTPPPPLAGEGWEAAERGYASIVRRASACIQKALVGDAELLAGQRPSGTCLSRTTIIQAATPPEASRLPGTHQRGSRYTRITRTAQSSVCAF